MRVGDEVIWLQKAGGGGGSGHRPNPVRPRQVEIVAFGPRRVRVRTLDLEVRTTWVNRTSLACRLPHGLVLLPRLDGRLPSPHLRPRP